MIELESQKLQIEDALRWDPRINELHISVSIEDRVIVLRGEVASYSEKWAADEVAGGVCADCTIVTHVTVKRSPSGDLRDKVIADQVHEALKWSVFDSDDVTAQVHNGRVTLVGEVTFNFNREEAERAITALAGVVSVQSAIIVRRDSSNDVSDKIQAAKLRWAVAVAHSKVKK